MATYNPNIQISNDTGASMTNIVLYHVWPQAPGGPLAEVWYFESLGAGNDTTVVQGNSGSGGFDWWTLTFGLSPDSNTNPTQYAMPPTVVQISSNGTPTQKLLFTVEADQQQEVNAANPYGGDVVGNWSTVGSTETFLSTTQSSTATATLAAAKG